MRALAKLAAGLLAVAGCHGLSGQERLGGGSFDAGALHRRDGSADQISVPIAADAGAPANAPPAPGPPFSGEPPGDGGAPACVPASTAGDDAGIGPPADAWSAATAVPFSCDPMANVFFFPRPTADVAGAYARCASYADARASALAVSSDGKRVALIGIDGIARIVDVASHEVVGVLAPARASVKAAAFSAAGDAILTIASGERVVTLWRTDTFKPVWSTTLPGHTYADPWSNIVAFSPDGSRALASPGAGLYLLDTATGAIVATRTSSSVLTAAYGLNGQRIAVLEAPIAGMCAHGPFGGSVTILDPATLAAIATPISWPLQGDESPPPGRLLVAAGADLLLAADDSVHAFQISDGSPLPAPGVEADLFPVALTPDGASGVVATSGVLELVRVEDGTVTASSAADAPTALALSADGSTIAAGSSGADLLQVWHPAGGPLASVCSAEKRSGGSNVGLSLSSDGQTIAVEWGTELRIFRAGDGAPTSTIAAGNSGLQWFELSPDGREALASFTSRTGTTTLGVYQTADGTELRNLASDAGCGSLLFRPGDGTLDLVCSRNGTSSMLTTTDVSTGAVTPVLTFAGADTTLAGLSAGCDVVADPQQHLVWRACAACSDPPFATHTSGGVLSQDGSAFLGQDDGGGELNGATLWRVLPGGAVIRTYPPRPEETTMPSEFPIAVSAHGDRVVTGAHQVVPCSYAPLYTSRVHDVASDTIVDELPPNVTTASADLSILAIGPVLWCAR